MLRQPCDFAFLTLFNLLESFFISGNVLKRLALSMTPSTKEAAFMKACRREATSFTPIWLLRQAGRYMKEYRNVRAKVGFLQLCQTPDLASEVTVTAQEKIGADAAIIFSDILLIAEPLGFRLEFTEEEGPVISNPFRTEEKLKQARAFDVKESLGFVLEAIRLTRRALKSDVPLIGFAGAPFTVASYLIEGGKSKDFGKIKSMMRNQPATWNALLEAISKATADYLRAQIVAGADAVQLFDSWIGVLNVQEYRETISPHVQRVFSALPKEVPAVHFGTKCGHLLSAMKEAGGSVIGLDSGVDLDKAWKELGHVAVQGNLDPAVLLRDRKEIAREARKILRQADGRPGHIFNLGHGVLPATPVENVRFLIDLVHEESAR